MQKQCQVTMTSEKDSNPFVRIGTIRQNIEERNEKLTGVFSRIGKLL